jgi:hypothetical protein
MIQDSEENFLSLLPDRNISLNSAKQSQCFCVLLSSTKDEI